jgi:hypothetical protein
MNRFDTDTIAGLYDNLANLQDNGAVAVAEYRELAMLAINAQCDYEEAKNKTILELKLEEDASEGKIKRTESVREAIYRTEHADLRRAWLLTAESLKTQKIFLDAMKEQISALQTRIRLIEFQERGAK